MFAFYRKFLEQFQNANTIVLGYPRQWILEVMVRNCERIRYINIKGVFSYLVCTENCTIKVSIKKQAILPECLVHSITKDCAKFDKPASVQFFQNEESLCDLATDSIIPFAKFITHLCIISCYVSEAQLKLLTDAVTYGMMPRLSHLNFISCQFVTLSPFLGMKWPHLSHLNFHSCCLGQRDCQSLAEAVSYKFTNLTSLTVVDHNKWHFLDIIFKHGLLYMRDLFLGFHLQDYTGNLRQLTEAANAQKMPNLSSLSLAGIKDISPVLDLLRTQPLQSLALLNFDVTKDKLIQMSSEISRVKLRELNLSNCPHVGKNLSALLSDSFPLLQTLILRQCNLESQELLSLTRASADGKLRGLKYLDISFNYYAGSIKDLFTYCCQWNELLSLNILHTFHQYDVGLPSNCFRSLQHLSVSDRTLHVLLSSRILWQSLQKLRVSVLDEITLKTITDIVAAQDRNLLPSLITLCVHQVVTEVQKKRRSVFDFYQTHKLRNVCIHDAESYRDYHFPRDCVCYDDR